MKYNYSVAERNRIVEDHLHFIDRTIRRNRALIRAAHLDRDDIYQQLAVRLIQAVAGFDPEKGDLEQHICAQLQDELLNYKGSHQRYGFTGAPYDLRGAVISLEACGDIPSDSLMAA